MSTSNKTILFLSFYFTPDLCAGSFRNSTLLDMIESQSFEKLNKVVITTKPNRYKDFRMQSKAYERRGSVEIYRIQIPDHQSGIIDQIRAFVIYFYKGFRIAYKYKPALVYASTSRLFTGFLGALCSRLGTSPLYLDVRDIFLDTIMDIYKRSVVRYLLYPVVSLFEKFTMQSARHINLISSGFENYFYARYPDKKYSNFSNGVDALFLTDKYYTKTDSSTDNLIVYAGNIGEGQGLHILLPGLAKYLPEYQIVIIGDGGAKQRLLDGIQGLPNVQLMQPMPRDNILEYYQKASYTLIHLNNNKAFKKVLPSKVFELAAINKPILAGVDGYASQFLAENVEDCLLFKPGDYNEAAKLIHSHQYRAIDRDLFKIRYSRRNINRRMAKSILSYAR
jgi:glycosyltransferase involved in cell wall biosynthesis